MTQEPDPPETDDDPDGRKSLRQFLWVLVFALPPLLWITLRQAEQYPELSAFGVQQWTLRCSDGERTYLLKSDNPIDGATNTRSYTDRNLHFLAADGSVIHSSYAFVPEALGQEGVWRWDLARDERKLLADWRNDHEGAGVAGAQRIDINADFSGGRIAFESEDRPLTCERTD